MPKRSLETYLITLVLTLSVAGCLPEDDPEPPELTFQTDVLRAEIVTPGSQSFPLQLDNSGPVKANFSISSDSPVWIDADPISGELEVSDNTEVQATLSCTTVGSFSGSITAYDENDNALDSVPVELNCVAAPEPEISELDPASFQLAAIVNTNAQATVAFSNSGDASLNYQLETQSSWISFSSTSGSLGMNESASIGITASCASTIETRSGTINVRSNDPDEATKTANIELVCNGEPQPDITELNPPSLSRQLQTGESASFSFGFGNAGNERLSYQISSDSNWINVASDTNGTINPGSVVEINASASCGNVGETRAGTLRVSSNDPDEGTKRFAVELECQIPQVPEISELNPSSLSLSAQLDAQTVARFDFSNEGSQILDYSVETASDWIEIVDPLSGALDSGVKRTVAINASCGSNTETRTGEVLVRSTDQDEPTKTLPVELSCGGEVNLSLNRVYLNQAAPTADSNRSEAQRVPALAGRPGLLRAFVSSSSEINGVEATLNLRINGGAVRTLSLNAPSSLSANVSEADLDDTFNILLTAQDMVEGLEYYVEVDPNNLVNESDETDNRFPETGYASFDVREPGTFRVVFVPVEWEGRLPDTIDPDEYLEDTKAMMPVGAIEASVRSAPLIADSDASIPCDVLGDLSRLRQADGLGNSTTHYYGVITSGRGSGVIGCAFAPGYSGASLSISDLRRGGALETVAHELGHNLSLSHAPCGGPSGADPDYPYSNAAIGTWGYNVFNGATYDPGSNLKDLMSYCGPVWISDFHYERALDYRDRRSSRAQLASTEARSLLVSGYVEAGQVVLEAVTELEQAPSLPGSGDYELVIVDDTGADAIRLSFSTTKADHTDREFFSLRVPIPARPAQQLKILQSGMLAAERRSKAQSLQKSSVVPITVSKTSAGRTRVTWDAAKYESAVIRDGLDGLVVAFDSSGEVVFTPTASEVSVVLSDGLISYPYSFAIE